MRTALLLALAGCAAPAGIPLTGQPPEDLAELGLTRGFADGHVQLADGLVPYTLNTPLFSDHALKERAIRLPEGEAATYVADDALLFPVGTAIVKSFLFPADLRRPDEDVRVIETRVLIHQEAGWTAWPYLWDEDGTAATLQPGGRIVPLVITDLDGEEQDFDYLVPQRNQCLECHEIRDPSGERVMTVIGPKARHLHRTGPDGTDQLAALADAGQLDGLPALEEVPAATDWAAFRQQPLASRTHAEVTTAARDYLDINCAHCHNPRGVNGETSQLWLNHDNADTFRLGFCKRPGSAGKGGRGRTWDVVPGDAEASILHYRLVTDDVGAMMPQVGRSLVDAFAGEVVAAWIDGLEAERCGE